MENIDKTIGTAARLVGPTIKQIGKELDFSLYEMKENLAASMKEQGWSYQEETINGFLYGRPWPDSITRNMTIEIIGNAFEQILIKNGRSDEIQAVQEKIASTLKKLFDDCENDAASIITQKVLAEFLLINLPLYYIPLISKHFKACCSLSNNDMEFWSIISEWSPERKKRQYKKWDSKKFDFQTIISPAFQQWLSIYGKNFYDQIRKEKNKEKKKALNPSQKFKKQFDKLTGNEASSLIFLWERLMIAEKANDQRTNKYPFGPPEEIGLLLLFKYGFSSDEQKKMLEKQKEQQKAAGD